MDYEKLIMEMRNKRNKYLEERNKDFERMRNEADEILLNPLKKKKSNIINKEEIMENPKYKALVDKFEARKLKDEMKFKAKWEKENIKLENQLEKLLMREEKKLMKVKKPRQLKQIDEFRQNATINKNVNKGLREIEKINKILNKEIKTKRTKKEQLTPEQKEFNRLLKESQKLEKQKNKIYVSRLKKNTLNKID